MTSDNSVLTLITLTPEELQLLREILNTPNLSVPFARAGIAGALYAKIASQKVDAA